MDGRGCDFSRSGAARYFCETCPAGRFQVKAAQKASCVDCVFPSTNFGGGDVCDACLDGYVNTVDNGTAVCRECPRGFLCHEGSTRRNVTLRRGFWRAAYELEATKCRKRNCEGGIGKGDALCRDGSMGPACDVCSKRRAPSRSGTGRLCADANAAVLFATLVVVVMALLIIGGRVSKSTLADEKQNGPATPRITPTTARPGHSSAGSASRSARSDGIARLAPMIAVCPMRKQQVWPTRFWTCG